MDARQGSGVQEQPPCIGLVRVGPLAARIRAALSPDYEISVDAQGGSSAWVVLMDPSAAAGACALRQTLDRNDGIPCIALLPESSAATLARSCLQAGAIDAIPLELLDRELEPAVRSALARTAGASVPDRAPDGDREAHELGLALALNEVRQAYDETLAALAAAVDCREKETACHSQRVATYSLRIGMGLGLDHAALEDLYRGSLLHDLGKIGTPDAILLKPGLLTPAEWAVMREHPETGSSLVENIPFLERARSVLASHHEAWDGSGYPEGLAGTDIPLAARIFAVADTYDALRSVRPYKQAGSHGLAIETIRRAAGSRLDPAIAEWFVEQPGETWERLSSLAIEARTFHNALRACRSGESA